MTIAEFLISHGAFIDENNRIHIRCRCDSTLLFLVQMVECLKQIGCTDIQTDSYFIEDENEIPKDKPWCNWMYKASGILPQLKGSENKC